MNIWQTIKTAIAHAFTALFSSAKHAFNALPVETQNAMISGSGAVDLITSMIDHEATAIHQAIQDKFPQLPLDQIENALVKGAAKLGLGTLPTGIDAINALKTYFIQKPVKSEDWAWATHCLALLFSILWNPNLGVKFSAFTQLIEYVYVTFIQKKTTDEVTTQ